MSTTNLCDTIVRGDLFVNGGLSVGNKEIFTTKLLTPVFVGSTTTVSPTYGSSYRSLASFSGTLPTGSLSDLNGFYICTYDYIMVLFIINNINSDK
jgi:hypothetical protein